MKVRVGDMIYDSKHEPIMLVLDAKDKINIINMAKGDNTYCVAPSVYDKKELIKFMDIDTSLRHTPSTDVQEKENHKKLIELLLLAGRLITLILHDSKTPSSLVAKYDRRYNNLMKKINRF